MLLDVMARLRSPQGGCPWDLEADLRHDRPYTIEEEAYEVADAIGSGGHGRIEAMNWRLVLQVASTHRWRAECSAAFDFEAVAAGIAEKMVRRHPHVFGDVTIETADAQTAAWEDHNGKRAARQGLGRGSRAERADGVAAGLAGPHARDQAAAARGLGSASTGRTPLTFSLRSTKNCLK